MQKQFSVYRFQFTPPIFRLYGSLRRTVNGKP
jgi:hypothetical protein